MALNQEIHLRAKGGAGLFAIKIRKKRIVFAIGDAAAVHAVGQKAREGGFARRESALQWRCNAAKQTQAFCHAAWWWREAWRAIIAETAAHPISVLARQEENSWICAILCFGPGFVGGMF